jgi:hypothetical protein
METACTQLREGTREITEWEWEESSAAALAQFESQHDGKVLALVTELLPHSWDQIEIKTAPEPVRHVSGVWGGLMAGQRLFVRDPEIEPMLFAAWWPWGNREKFSLRVSCTAWSEAVLRADPQAKLRGFFGL